MGRSPTDLTCWLCHGQSTDSGIRCLGYNTGGTPNMPIMPLAMRLWARDVFISWTKHRRAVHDNYIIAFCNTVRILKGFPTAYRSKMISFLL